MRFTFIHKRSPFQSQLECRGSYLCSRVYSLANWRKKTGGGPEDWPATEAELKEAGMQEGMKDVMALQETAHMAETEKQRMEEAIADGLQNMKTRFRYNPAVPEVPDDIFAKANASLPEDFRGPYDYDYLDMDYWLDYYPSLDQITMDALLQQCDTDLFPNFGILAFGAHLFSQSWTDVELQQWCEGMKGCFSQDDRPTTRILRKLTPTKRAELLAELTWGVMNYAMQSVHMGDLEHVVKLTKPFSLQELLVEADRAGIDISEQDRDDKAAVVLAVVEHIYSDVVEPTVTA